MRLVVVVGICVLLAAACGGGQHRLSLRSTEAAVRSAGFGRLRVLGASAAVGRLRSEGFDVKGLRNGTPDYVIPESAPFVSVLRFVSVDRARAVRNRAYIARVCNVVVYNSAPTIKVAQRGADRIVAALKKRCH